MNKIIGFYISRELIEFDPDIFKTGISKHIFRQSNLFICIWGLGDLKSLLKEKYFSLSFFQSRELLDRNVVISLKETHITIENDWLGSIPVFFNKNKGIVSTIPNLCLTDKVINFESLANFMQFGYSVFEKTPFNSVQFMRYFSKIIITRTKLEIVSKPDPVSSSNFLKGNIEEKEVLELIEKYIANIEGKTEGDIVVPTSGGYDSRLLNLLVKDKTRIKSFTYGISKDQTRSHEVVYASKISELLKTEWNQIKLNHYHKYLKEWFSIYGVSTHLHGMYQIEFYTKIIQKQTLNNPTLLSGIIGDLWASSDRYLNIRIETSDDIVNLGLTHGIQLNSDHLKFHGTKKDLNQFLKKNEKFFLDNRLQSVFSVRLKIILLSYLTQIPEYFGIPAWTPFLNYEIVRSMLRIKNDRRKNRIWQRDFFFRSGVNLESMRLKSYKSNKLNFEIARKNQVDPINIELMSRFIQSTRIKEINKILSDQGHFNKLKDELLFVPVLGGILKRLGFKNDFLVALNEYYIIKSIENGLTHES